MCVTWVARWLLLAALLIFAGQVVALYEDEVGVNDWYSHNLGKVNHAVYQVTQLKKRVYVATEQKVVAAIALKSNQLEWRHVLPDPIVNLQLSKTGYLLVSSPRAVRLFDSDGNLVVEKSADHIMASFCPQGNCFVTVSDRYLVDMFSIDGKQIGSQIALETNFEAKAIKSRDVDVMIVGKQSVAYIRTNAEHSTKRYDSGPQAVTHSVLTQNVIALFDTEKNLVHLAPTDGSITFTTVDLSPIFGDKSVVASRLEAHANGDLILATLSTGSRLLLRVTPKNIVLLKSWAKEVMVAQTTVDNKPFILTAANTATETQFELFSSDQLDQSVARFSAHSNNPSAIMNMFGWAQVGKDNKYHVRVLVQREDWVLQSFYSSNKTAEWERTEFLAAISHSIFVELPAKPQTHIAKDSSFVTQFAQRIQGEIQDLLAFFETVVNEPNEIVQSILEWLNLGGKHAHHHDLYADRYGFRQLIVVTTASGSVAALHTDGGEIAWHRYLPTSAHTTKLLLIRKSIHGIPEVLIATKPSDTRTVLFTINALTGEVLSEATYDFNADLVIRLPQIDKEGRHLVLVVESEKNCHVFPNNPTNRELVIKMHNVTFYYIINKEKGDVVGYKLTGAMSGEVLRAEPVWKVSLSAPIVAYTQSMINTNTPARVLGDKSILYKYLNPNMVILASEKKAYTNAEGKQSLSSQVVITAIDAITGSIMHRTVHKSAKGPVAITQAENWVVYSYWSTKAQRMEVAAFELFIRDATWEGQVFSSYEIPPSRIIAYQQAYNLPASCRVLATTVTSQGITEKSILFGLENGEVLALSRKFVDPRRPESATLTEQERNEGLIPYQPLLPNYPIQYINYNRTVVDIRGIKSAPSHLESTSLVFVYGLDVFYTPVAPNHKAYDRLGHDFNRLAIVGMLVVFAILALGAQRIAKKRELQRAWK